MLLCGVHDPLELLVLVRSRSFAKLKSFAKLVLLMGCSRSWIKVYYALEYYCRL